jgi:hypothetical protein
MQNPAKTLVLKIFIAMYPIKKAAQGQTPERQKSHEYPSSFLNHAVVIKPAKA